VNRITGLRGRAAVDGHASGGVDHDLVVDVDLGDQLVDDRDQPLDLVVVDHQAVLRPSRGRRSCPTRCRR
jgi:hypothetical protein